MELSGKSISIIGAGRSGMAAAVAVKEMGGTPFVSDSSGDAESKAAPFFSKIGVDYEFGIHSERVFDSDLVVVSPGVPPDSEIIEKSKSKGLTVWPEVELAFRLCKGKVIGVTGSNGKTTTTTLIGKIMKKAGIEVEVCGNIGRPFISVASGLSGDGFAVVELSSFQLELIDQFGPHVAVFLNITPDHLDRHGDFESYFSSKMRIFENQARYDFAVINHDDLLLRDRCGNLLAKTIWFSVGREVRKGVYADPDGNLVADGEAVVKSRDIRIRGEHNLSNACASAAAALAVGIEKKVIAGVLKSFPGVEHRLEPVRLIGGVSFINDSKGTNVDSVRWALKAVSAPVILIAGGKDKGGDFSLLNDLISEKVKSVILIGQAAKKISSAWNELVECRMADNLENAVVSAYEIASSGDTVLLSPGCASFDMFENFEHRGRVFKAAVEKLALNEVAQ